MPAALKCPDDATLRLLLLGQLADDDMQPLGGHLLACPDCTDRADTLDIADALTVSLGEVSALDESDDPLARRLSNRMYQLGALPLPPDAEATSVDVAPTDPLIGSPSPSPSGTAPVPGDRPFPFLSPAQAPDELGRLGGYRILKVLGQGGMGVVFQAEDPRLNRRCALKVMLPEIALKPGMKERFLREARAAAQIEHDQIIPIFQVDEDRGVPYIAMPLLKGLSLEDWLQRPGRGASPADVPTILSIGRQVAEGLAAAHQCGLIHRDIKPANVWLESSHLAPRDVSGRGTGAALPAGEKGRDDAVRRDRLPVAERQGYRIKILDFGLARLSEAAGDEQLTQSGAILGTPSYMAPEQARGEAIDGRADLFSLGVILYRLCTGTIPFKGKDTLSTLLSLATHDPPPPHVVNPAIPQPLSKLVMKLLAKDRDQRIGSAQELIEAIDSLQAQQEEAAKAATIAPPRRKSWAIAAVLLALAGLSWLLGPAVYRFVTNQGQLVIETDDPNIEITVRGDQVRIIDVKSGGQVSLQAGKYHAELTKGEGLELLTNEFTLSRGGRQVVHVRHARTAPAVVEAPQLSVDSEPFVVLARDGRIAKRRTSLSQAIANAESGDTIEIHGNGPFVLQPIDLRNKALTLRAASGYWPVLKLAPEAVQADLPLVSTQAALVLEGLEFHRDGDGNPDAVDLNFILAQRAPLAVANCRFMLRTKANSSISAVAAHGSPSVEVRNCQFIGHWHSGPALKYAEPGSRMSVANSLFLTRRSAVTVGFRDAERAYTSPALVRLTANTMVVGGPAVSASGVPSAVQNLASAKVRIEALENSSTSGLAGFFYFTPSQEVEEYLQREHRSVTRGLFSLEERGNHIAAGAWLAWFSVITRDAQSRLLGKITTAAEWNAFWNLEATDSTVGKIAFARPLSSAEPDPDRLTPQDFRIVPDGPSGKVRGADVDLVGPGPAYERWKQTPQYQEWLRDSGQAKAEPGAKDPFAVLDAKSKQERPFASLASAVAAAASGDTIEIRGNGPFLTPPIKIARRLHIRSGAGFRPVIKLSPEAETAKALIEASAPLVLEGLELQRLDSTAKARDHWLDQINASSALYAANCRFVTRNVEVHIAGVGPHLTEARNCEFLSPPGFVRSDGSAGYTNVTQTWPGRRVVLDNCLLTARINLATSLADPRGAVFRLTHNTWRSPHGVAFIIYADSGDVKEFAEADWRVKSLDVHASDNVFATDTVFLFSQAQMKVAAPPGEAEALLARIAGWQGERNVYTADAGLLSLMRLLPTVSLPPPELPAGLAGWKQLWGTPEQGSMEGRVSFRGGDLLAKTESDPERITPDDFRLLPGSAGYRAAHDGKDLGADVDLVGPGPAYERWKQTPQYQEWLQETGQMK